MACSSPNLLALSTLTGERKFLGKDKADRFASDYRPKGYELYRVGCGQCLHCRLGRAAEWGIRCVHEQQMHEKNSFITLTYNPKNLPKHGNLIHEDFQLFMKKLRFHSGAKIKYVMCGEYGKKGTTRPHYHACVFGYDFEDKRFHSQNKWGDTLYTSEELLSYWQKGHVTTGELNFKTAKYVGRYCTKKISGDLATEHYERLDDKTGELVQLKREYLFASNGIGLSWLKKFRKDLYDGYTVIKNKGQMEKFPIPRYYKKKLEELYPEDFKDLRNHAIKRGMEKNDRLIKKGETPLARAHQSGKFLSIINADAGRRSYEDAT